MVQYRSLTWIEVELLSKIVPSSRGVGGQNFGQNMVYLDDLVFECPPIASPHKVVFILKSCLLSNNSYQISDNKEYLQDASESKFTFIYQKFYN